MHILIIPYLFPTLENPAAGSFVKRQAIALSKKGIKVGIISIDIKKITEILPSESPYYKQLKSFITDIPVYQKKGINFLPKLRILHQYYWKVWVEQLYKEYVKDNGQPDMVHAHFGLWGGYAALNLFKKKGIPYIITEHSSYFVEKKFSKLELELHKDIYAKAQKVITVSESLKEEVKKVCGRKDILVIPNSIDTDFFVPGSKKEEFIFSLGNLIQAKGFEALINSFAIVSSKYPSLKLKIGGKGFFKTELITLCKKLNLDNKVEFVGELNRNQVRDYMQSAKVFALTSRFETFGIVYIEALACGTAVLATKCGGPEEIINPSVGVLCEVDNVKEISDGLEYLLSSEFNPQELHQYIKNNFSDEATTGEIIKAYLS